jgi:hypothetical protein
VRKDANVQYYEVVPVYERSDVGFKQPSSFFSKQTGDPPACLNVMCLLKYVLNCEQIRFSAVSTATGYGMDDRGIAVRYPVM